MNKKGRLGSVLFVIVFGLPLLALFIMDYQLKRANDITGQFMVSRTSEVSMNNFYTSLIFLIVFIGVLAIVAIRKSVDKNPINTEPLAEINAKIESIDKKLKN